MSCLLRVFIGENWSGEQGSLPWALLAGDGKLLQEGVAEDGSLPAAETCEAIISGVQAVWLRTHLPEKLPRSAYERVLALALDAQLIDDPERYHLAVTDQQDGEIGVLAISRERLGQIVAHFSAFGRPLSRAYSELQTAPLTPDGWHLSLGIDTVILRREAHDGLALDPGEAGRPPALLAKLLKAANGEVNALPSLTLHVPLGVEPPDWSDGGCQVVPGTPYSWYAVTGDCANLLQGEFSPQLYPRAWLKFTGPVGWLIVAVLAADILAGIFQVGWQRYQTLAMERSTTALFQEAFPNIPPLDPVAQIKRQNDLLRSALGLLRRDDALTLLASLADAMPVDGNGPVAAVRYDEGLLKIRFSPGQSAMPEALLKRLAERGLEAQLESDGPDQRQLTIRPGPRQ